MCNDRTRTAIFAVVDREGETTRLKADGVNGYTDIYGDLAYIVVIKDGKQIAVFTNPTSYVNLTAAEATD